MEDLWPDFEFESSMTPKNIDDVIFWRTKSNITYSICYER